jgi:glycosyltransferase involved in cell wall biosynthesis
MDELDLARTVRFLGHREDVPEILAAADAFVFPSLFEGLPGAVIEAMALGLPVVASAIAPLREVIEPGENGLLVPAGSVESLADAVGPLLEDPARREALGRRGRELYEERWTLETSVPRMAELYRSMAAGSHAGR